MSILEISFCNSSNGYPTKKLDLSCELPPWSRVVFRHKIPHVLGNQNVLYHAHKNLSLVYILKHMSPTHLLTPCFLNNHFNIILPSIPGSCQVVSSVQVYWPKCCKHLLHFPCILHAQLMSQLIFSYFLESHLTPICTRSQQLVARKPHVCL